MRIPSNPSSRPANPGYALLITLVFLSASLVLLGSMMFWVSSSTKQTASNEQFTSTQAAAEAATEKVVATLELDYVSQTLQSASYYQTLVPAKSDFPNFGFSDGSGNANLTGVTIGVQHFTNNLGAAYTNLSGYVEDSLITSTATITNPFTVSATVQQHVGITLIPLFQFAIFYNMNLEIDPGAAMVLKGPVFSNGGIWAGTPNVTFNSTVGAVGLVNTNGTDPWASGKTDSGTPLSNFGISPISGEDSLNLPIGTNNDPGAVEGLLNLPPTSQGAPNAYAYTTNGQVYMFNQADLIISNAASGLASAKGTNLTIWFQDSANASALTMISNDCYVVTNRGGGTTYITNYVNPSSQNVVTNVLLATYSFVTNVSFYDYRESDTVQAVQLDVSKLNVWLTNSAATGGRQYNAQNYNDKGRGIDSVYVYNKVPSISGQLPAVRLVNGAQLPYTTDPGGSGVATGGLNVVTPQPLYVKGNFNVQTATSSANASAQTTNTAYTYPASIMGDAVTILSANWQDTYNSSTALSSRAPINTTVNAACLEGIVQSTNSNYSGGVENFLRLLENWNNSSTTLQYNGSIVVMFQSIYATSFWQSTGNYYNAPKRNWAFDLNFTDPSKLPQLMPRAKKIIRLNWTTY